MRRSAPDRYHRQPTDGWRRTSRILACFLFAFLMVFAASCRAEKRHFTQLFVHLGQVYTLEGSGTLYNLTQDVRATQPLGTLPVGDATGIVSDGRYFYVKGRNLMAFDIARQTNEVLLQVDAGLNPSLQMVMAGHLIFGTSRRVEGRYGDFTYFDHDLEKQAVTPLVGAPFTDKRLLTFLAFFDDHLYFTDQKTLKLAAMNLVDREIHDLSGQVDDVLTHACISDGLLYLNAWRKALYVKAPALSAQSASEPAVQKVQLAPEMGDPGAMSPFDGGVLLALDNPGLSASIYWLKDVDPLTGTGFQLSRVSSPDQFNAWNVWQIIGSGDRFYCIAAEGRNVVAGQVSGVSQ